MCEDSKYVYLDAKINTLTMSAFQFISLTGLYIAVAYTIKREKEQEEIYVNRIQNAASQLSSYKKAVLSDALISLEVNLNKDSLDYGVWKDDSGNEVPLKKILGLETPYSYDEYNKM